MSGTHWGCRELHTPIWGGSRHSAGIVGSAPRLLCEARFVQTPGGMSPLEMGGSDLLSGEPSVSLRRFSHVLWEGGDPAGILGWSRRPWPCTEKEPPSSSSALLVPERDRCLPYAGDGVSQGDHQGCGGISASRREGQCRVRASRPSHPTPSTRGMSSPVCGEQTGQDFCLCRHSEVSLSDPKSTEIEFPLFCRGGE